MKTLTRILATLLLSLQLSLPVGITLGCTRTESTHSALQIGERPFSFDYGHAKEILVAKWDRQTGENWTARAEKNDERWTLRSGTDRVLADDVASASTIEHLLDSLSALQVQKSVDRQDPESQGLAPPRFAIRWSISAPGTATDFEIKIGAPSNAEGARSGSYATIRRGKEPEKTVVVTGSALKLLQHVESFNSLRHAEWATEHVDDVDEVEFKRDGKLLSYVQREGDRWTDKNHRPVRLDVTATLEKLLRARIEQFIEEKEAVSKAKTSVIDLPGAFEFVIKDRHGNPTTFRAARVDKGGTLLGINSRRPNAAFVLAPGTMNAFPASAAR